MKINYIDFGYKFGVLMFCWSAAPAWAGTAPVNAVSPPDAGVAPGPVYVQEGPGVTDIVQPFVYDNVLQSTESIVGTNAASPQFLSNQAIPDATISVGNIVSGSSITPSSVAANVATSVAQGSPVTIQIARGRLEVTPAADATTLAVIQQSITRTQEFVGAPTQVNQQVATVTALTAAGATPEATQAGSSISGVGVQAPGVVDLILGFQDLVGDFSTASLPSDSLQAQMPVLIASAEIPAGLLVAEEQGRRVDVQQLNAVIVAYNQLITDCPADALPKLASNPEFQAIGEALRQLRAAIE